MSMGGGKLKPEDLFASLKQLKMKRIQEEGSVSLKFFERFSNQMTESNVVSMLKGESIEIETYL
jgi:hypothetical protein